MRSLPIASLGAALFAACLLTTAPGASAETPAPAPASSLTPATATPSGPPAVALASTPEALSSELTGKTFFMRGFYEDDKLDFATDGTPIGSPQRGSFALSGVQIDKVKFTKHSVQIEAHRVGLHFFGALPYEDDSKPYERIVVNPKKTMDIEIERVVIEPEKKKKKDKKDKDNKEAVAAAPVAPPPEHDPRISFLQLSKAINVIFAPGLNDSVIATLPHYWQNYFASKEGRARAARINASVLRPGGEVRAPRLLTILDPVSNDYAQRNNIAGMVFLEMVVGADGRPGSVSIVRPIGFGLDERAVDAVEHAQFSPGSLNGKPVPELINLQVTFRIYSNRTRPTGPPPTQVAPRRDVPPSNAPVLASAAGREQ